MEKAADRNLHTDYIRSSIANRNVDDISFWNILLAISQHAPCNALGLIVIRDKRITDAFGNPCCCNLLWKIRPLFRLFVDDSEMLIIQPLHHRGDTAFRVTAIVNGALIVVHALVCTSAFQCVQHTFERYRTIRIG